MRNRATLPIVLLAMVAPVSANAQERGWNGTLVPYVGSPVVDDIDALPDHSAIDLGVLVGVSYDLELPLPWLALRGTVNRSLGAKVFNGSDRADGAFGSVGIDVRLSPVPRDWLVRPFLAYGPAWFYASHAARGSLDRLHPSWRTGSTAGIGADVGRDRWSLRVEATVRRYSPFAEFQDGHFLLSAGLLLPLH